MSTAPQLAERPAGRPRVSFHWVDLLFMHWSIPAEQLRGLIPKALEIDTYDGRAWIGLVPFSMTHIRRTPLPAVPGTSRFHECNVRTYVKYNDQAGVYFFSLDASHALACAWARRFWHLNYVHSRIGASHENRRYAYDLQRVGEPSVTLRCEWWRGSRLRPRQPGTLDHFLTERYAMYTQHRDGGILRGRIWHEPWTLRQAELVELDENLLHTNRIEIDRSEQPLVHHCDDLYSEAWPLERCS